MGDNRIELKYLIAVIFIWALLFGFVILSAQKGVG